MPITILLKKMLQIIPVFKFKSRKTLKTQNLHIFANVEQNSKRTHQKSTPKMPSPLEVPPAAAASRPASSPQYRDWWKRPPKLTHNTATRLEWHFHASAPPPPPPRLEPRNFVWRGKNIMLTELFYLFFEALQKNLLSDWRKFLELKKKKKMMT